MIKIRRALPAVTAVALVLAACGGSDEGAADETVPPTAAEAAADDTEEAEDFTEVESDDTAAEAPADTEPAADDTEAPADTEPAADDTAADEAADEADPEADTGDAAAGSAVDVALSEWAIDAPTEYTAGEVTFNATNGGSFPHELVVIQGESYESLPLGEGGAVIEEDLPTGALIGRIDRFSGTDTGTLTVELAPGNYVLVCNLGGGSNSHAGQGQRLDITVS